MSDWIAVAVLGRPRGNRGELTATSLSSKPERFARLGDVRLVGDGPSADGVSHHVEEVWQHDGALVFKFRGVDSISDAEKLRGAEVQVPRAERVELEPGEYFHSDLIGCEVRDRVSGRLIGRVTNFEEYDGPPLLEVDGGRLLIPFVKAICTEILPEEKLIRVVARAAEAGALQLNVHDLRNWTRDLHRTVDDRPFGGGEGMLLKPEPIFDAVETIWPSRGVGQKVILLSAQGRKFTQGIARELLQNEELLLICGRYEGVDERVAEHLADDELSIGDYVLSGGELAALVVVDTVARLLPGVVGNRDSTLNESFEDGILDCPQWTRPAEFRGWKAPEILLGGNHAEIRKWRKQAALEKTARRRPDLLETPSKQGIDDPD